MVVVEEATMSITTSLSVIMLISALATFARGDEGGSVAFTFTQRGAATVSPSDDPLYPLFFSGEVFRPTSHLAGRRDAWIRYRSDTCDHDVCYRDTIRLPQGTVSSEGYADILGDAPTDLPLHPGAQVGVLIAMHGQITDGTGAFAGATGTSDSDNAVMELDQSFAPVWVDMICTLSLSVADSRAIR
jgi:hypothetical protein